VFSGASARAAVALQVEGPGLQAGQQQCGDDPVFHAVLQ